MSTTILGVQLAAIVASGAVAVVGYGLRVKWQRHRAGAMYLALFLALWATGLHFLAEGLLGEAPQWIEHTLLVAVQAAVAWNLAGLAEYRATRHRNRSREDAP